MFRINSSGMLYFNTADAISLWDFVLTSYHNEDVTMGLDVVTIRQDMFILLCSDCNQPLVTVKSI